MANYNTTTTVMLNGQQAEDMLKKLTEKSKELGQQWKKFQEAGDTSGMKKVETQMKSVDKATEKLYKETLSVEKVLKNLSGASLNDLLTVQKKLNAEMAKMDRSSAEFKQAAKNAALLKNEISQTKIAMGQWSSPMQKIIGFAKGLLPAFGLTAIIGGLTRLSQSMIRIRSEFEKYEAVLTNSLGSNKKARQEMGMLQDFAIKTPFALSELTGAFVKLTNYGLKPSREELLQMGDLASSVGKGFDQLAEAIADAVTGQYERLKEFGIKASKDGEKVTFTFKEQSTTIDNTAESIQNYILSLGKLEGVAGSMAAISETMGGKISNLGDAWDNMLNAMGERTGGVVNWIVNTFTTGINRITKQLEILNAEELGFWEKWWGSTVGTNKTYDKLQGMREAANATSAGGDGPSELGTVTVVAKKITKADKEEKAKKAREDAIKKAEDAFELAAIEEKNILKQKLLDEKLTQEQYNLEMYSLELAHLIAMKELRSRFAQETTTVDAQILDKKIEGQSLVNKMLENAEKLYNDVRKNQAEDAGKQEKDILKDMEKSATEYAQNRDKQTQAEIENNIQKQQAAENLRDIQVQSAVEAGIAAVENAETLEEAGKAVINSIRDQIRAYLAEFVVTAALKALKGIPFPFNMIAATVAGAAATVLFNKLVPKFAAGKYPDMEFAGRPKTGMYGSNPQLGIFNEVPGQPEMVIDGVTVRKMQLNAPGIIESIYAVRDGRPPQYEKGKYPISNDNITSNPVANDTIRITDGELNNVLKRLTNEIKELREWRPAVSVELIDKQRKKYNDIQQTRGV